MEPENKGEEGKVEKKCLFVGLVLWMFWFYKITPLGSLNQLKFLGVLLQNFLIEVGNAGLRTMSSVFGAQNAT